MAQCSREAGADWEQLSRLISEGARGARGWWDLAGLSDFLVLARGGESWVDCARGSRELSVHSSSGIAAARGFAAGVGSEVAFSTVFPVLGQVFPWLDLIVP